MLARIRYYFSFLVTSFSEEGPIRATRNLISFCFRRKLGLSLLAESIDYHFISRANNPLDSVIHVHKFESQDIKTTKWAFYAHYHPASIITMDVFAQLSSLRRSGFSIVFITSSPSFSSQQILSLNGLCTIFIHRKNVGHDFGSWITAYHLLKACMASAETVILMNDSCYGPYNNLFESLLNSDADAGCWVQGISKSYLIEEHLQSYFLLFNQSTINNHIFSDYMNRIRLLKTKSAVVRYLEIGGSAFLKSHNILLTALVDPAELHIRQVMLQHSSIDPIKDPVGRELVIQGLTPLYKRSNGAPLDLPLFSA